MLQFRAKCSECKWDGLASELKHFHCRFRDFPICPHCKAKWNSKDRNVSSIAEYAIKKGDIE